MVFVVDYVASALLKVNTLAAAHARQHKAQAVERAFPRPRDEAVVSGVIRYTRPFLCLRSVTCRSRIWGRVRRCQHDISQSPPQFRSQNNRAQRGQGTVSRCFPAYHGLASEAALHGFASALRSDHAQNQIDDKGERKSDEPSVVVQVDQRGRNRRGRNRFYGDQKTG